MPAPTNAEIAYQQSGLLDRWTLYTTQLRDWLGGVPTGGPNGDGAYPLSDVTGQTFLVPCPAANSLKVTELTDPLEGLQATVDASVTASQAAQAAAEQARDIALTYRDAAISASGDSSMYATNSANSAADARTSATGAATSATAAATSETNAAASASAAADSKTVADSDAEAARQSALDAAASAQQAAQSAAGKLAWFGVWNIGGGTLPPAASVPGFYLVSGTATIGSESYADGDMLVWGEESEWHRIDNQQTVASVAGMVGTITVGQLQAALMLGSAAYKNVADFATSAQGAKADTALQGGSQFATAAQGAKADAALPASGGSLTGDATATPGYSRFAIDSAVGKTRIGNGGTGTVLTTNITWNGSAWVLDDATKPGFIFQEYSGGNYFQWLMCPVGGALTQLAQLDIDGWKVRNANGAGVARQPRIFIGASDPGAAAADNDLWVW